MKQDKILYGAAYYDEYMPTQRLDEDIQMMKEAHINVVRIAESTWSTEEPQEGVFDFSHVTRVLEAMEEAGISVIVGTPTYAIPPWLAHKYPQVMVMDQTGHRRPYGARQSMDIVDEKYRFYAERIIRKLMEAVQGYQCVIGFQLDNETKHYGTCSENVQQMFAAHMKEKFAGDLQVLNQAYGLDYWSNRINSWEEFPSMIGTINGSLGCAFSEFQRGLVTEYLSAQRKIVEEYRRDDQFVTHNLDFEWRGYSYGVQPDVNHFKVAQYLTRAGCDIYHPTQKHLTGKEIAFCGDLTRSVKKDNYYVLETQAQGFPNWTPYPGQIKLQAFSHLAAGADGVMYWHWHSIHNSMETYWKGILSHNLKENALYREVRTVGEKLAAIEQQIIHLKKSNKVAIMVSNEALTAMKWFPLNPANRGGTDYNDIVRWIYDCLFELHVECDFISPDETELSEYAWIILPALYSASEDTLRRIREYVSQGGCIFGTFKTAFTNENIKVWAEDQPYMLKECFGVTYDQFTIPEEVGLEDSLGGDALAPSENQAREFMELLTPKGAKVLAKYADDNWGEYAALTENCFENGMAYYLGCMTSPAYLKRIFTYILKKQGLWQEKIQTIASQVGIRRGENQEGRGITYYLNYSGEDVTVEAVASGTELMTGKKVQPGEGLTLGKWELAIVQE